MIDLTLLVTVVVIAGLISYVYQSVRTWRRLSHFPAPSRIAHFSYLWRARATFSGSQHWIHRDLNEKYGPLVRIGPNELLTDDPETLKRISSAVNHYPRSTWYHSGRFNPDHDNLLSLTDPVVHKRLKVRASPAYNGRDEVDHESCVDEQVIALVQFIRSRYANDQASDGKRRRLLDLSAMSCYFTMDVVCRLGFGKEAYYMRDEYDHYRFFQSIRELWPQMSTSADVPWIRHFLFTPIMLRLFGPRKTDKMGFGALMAVAHDCVQARFQMSGEPSKKDILYSLMKRGFDQTECEVEGLLILIAGTESTACALRAALVHVMTTPRVYLRLKEEIRAVAEKIEAGSTVISYSTARQCPYLHAVIYESLRMRPPLLGLFPKIVPDAGDIILGQRVPPGTAICANLSSLLRSEKIFGADADTFRPERFLQVDEVARSKMQQAIELSFGSGQWMCTGRNIALMELYKVVFELFRAFDLQLIDPMKPCEVQSYGVFIERGLRVDVREDPNCQHKTRDGPDRLAECCS